MALMRAESRGALTQWLIGQFFGGITICRRVDHGSNGGDDQDGDMIPALQCENTGNNQSGKRTDHINLTMGKIDQLNNSVNHGVSQRNQRIDAPTGQPSKKKLKKIFHLFLKNVPGVMD